MFFLFSRPCSDSIDTNGSNFNGSDRLLRFHLWRLTHLPLKAQAAMFLAPPPSHPTLHTLPLFNKSRRPQMKHSDDREKLVSANSMRATAWEISGGGQFLSKPDSTLSRDEVFVAVKKLSFFLKCHQFHRDVRTAARIYFLLKCDRRRVRLIISDGLRRVRTKGL